MSSKSYKSWHLKNLLQRQPAAICRQPVVAICWQAAASLPAAYQKLAGSSLPAAAATPGWPSCHQGGGVKDRPQFYNLRRVFWLKRTARAVGACVEDGKVVDWVEEQRRRKWKWFRKRSNTPKY